MTKEYMPTDNVSQRHAATTPSSYDLSAHTPDGELPRIAGPTTDAFVPGSGKATADVSFIYTRFASGSPQDDSEKRQVAACELYLQSLAPSTMTVFSDRNRSGIHMAGREGLQEMRQQAIRCRPRRIVIEDLDRLSRGVADLLALYAEFSALGVEIHDVRHGKLDLVGILLRGYANEEARSYFLTCAAHGRRRAIVNGNLPGRLAFGYRRDRRRVLPCCNAAPIVAQIFELVASGMSVQAVARRLTNHCVPTPGRGHKGGSGDPDEGGSRPWSGRAVRSIVKSPIYVGLVVYGRTCRNSRDVRTVELPDLAIVDRDLWHRANERLFGNAALPSRGAT